LQGSPSGTGGTVAACLPTRPTGGGAWRKMDGNSQLLLPFPSCTDVGNLCHLKKEQNATTSCFNLLSLFSDLPLSLL